MKYCPLCRDELQAIETDNAIRFSCLNPQCRYVDWNNPVPVVAALVNYQGRYVIARNVKWPRGIYSLISGYLEAGESPEQAVVREVREELGLQSEVMNFLGHFIFREKNQLLICFELCSTGRIKTNDELAEIQLLSAAELAAYDFSPLYITQQVIQSWQSLQVPS